MITKARAGMCTASNGAMGCEMGGGRFGVDGV